jgi:hypothetical protein
MAASCSRRGSAVAGSSRLIAAMQAKTEALATDYTSASGNLGHDQVYNQHIWAKAIHRIVREGVSPEQAVDEAIARIKEILQTPSERSLR